MAGKNRNFEPSHPNPTSPDTNTALRDDRRAPNDPDHPGYFNSSTFKPPYHNSPNHPYSDARVGIRAYVDSGRPPRALQELVFTTDRLSEYYDPEHEGIPDEYTAAAYAEWVVDSYIPRSRRLPPELKPLVGTDEDQVGSFEDVAAAIKRAADSYRRGTYTRDDWELLEAFRGVATDHHISDSFANGEDPMVPFGSEVSDPDPNKPWDDPDGHFRSIPGAVRRMPFQIIPHTDNDVVHRDKMGKNVERRRREAAHGVQMQTGVDTDHPGLKLSRIDQRNEDRRLRERSHVHHELAAIERDYVAQAFKRAPAFREQLVSAAKRNTPEDLARLTPVVPAPVPIPRLDTNKVTLTYQPLSTPIPGTDEYMSVWGSDNSGYLAFEHGDKTTLLHDPNPQTLFEGTDRAVDVDHTFIDGQGTRRFSYTPDGRTLIHVKSMYGDDQLDDEIIKFGEVIPPEEAISLQRQLEGAVNFVGHLTVESVTQPTGYRVVPNNVEHPYPTPAGYTYSYGINDRHIQLDKIPS